MADGSDIVEAKKAINCLVFAIDDATVLADVRRIMLGLVDEVERVRLQGTKLKGRSQRKRDHSLAGAVPLKSLFEAVFLPR